MCRNSPGLEVSRLRGPILPPGFISAGLCPGSTQIRTKWRHWLSLQIVTPARSIAVGATQGKSVRCLYDFFINRLRHPYELCPMLIALMVKPDTRRTRLLAWPEWGLLRLLYASPPRRALTAEGRLYERIGICTSEGSSGSETANDTAARDRAGASSGRTSRAVRWCRVGDVRGSVHGGWLVRKQRWRAAMAF